MEVQKTEVNALQPIKCQLGLLTRSTGSAMFCQGETIVLAAIHGPTESKPQKVLIDKANVEVYFRPKVGLPSVADRFKESLLSNTCETALMAALHPRMSVFVIIQEVQTCGELLSCAVNAACLAMLDAGVDMRFLVGAVTCALDASGRLLVDPPQLQQEHAQATFTFVFDSLRRHVVASHTAGTFSDLQFQQALLKCRSAVDVVFQFFRHSVSGAAACGN